jgi:hypothetical protein
VELGTIFFDKQEEIIYIQKKSWKNGLLKIIMVSVIHDKLFFEAFDKIQPNNSWSFWSGLLG